MWRCRHATKAAPVPRTDPGYRTRHPPVILPPPLKQLTKLAHHTLLELIARAVTAQRTPQTVVVLALPPNIRRNENNTYRTLQTRLNSSYFF